MALIEISNLNKTYDLGDVKVEALKSASLVIERGEYVCLIGPSGSGKSTLMNTLGCLDRPTSGSYLLSNEEIVNKSLDQRARVRNQQIGFVFQSFNLLSRTSALENVEVPLLYSRRHTRSERKSRAAAMLELVGLGDRLHHHPSQLSGGQQQRVAIARALINEPSILLADEPTGNLDSQTSREVVDLFRSLNEEKNITIIIVTHNDNIARNAQRQIVLHDGCIIADTTDADQALQALHLAQSDTGTPLP